VPSPVIPGNGHYFQGWVMASTAPRNIFLEAINAITHSKNDFQGWLTFLEAVEAITHPQNNF
jgi:hypothetical protein